MAWNYGMGGHRGGKTNERLINKMMVNYLSTE